MKPVKKFTSFDDLKSYERISVDKELSLKKHDDLEKVINDIRLVKAQKGNQVRPKR